MQEAIRINMLYSGSRLPAEDVSEDTPYIENINYENIRCDYSERNVIQIIGIPEMPVRNISFTDIELGGKQGIEITDAKDITFNNISVSNTKGPFAEVKFSNNIVFDNVTVVKTDENTTPFVFQDVTDATLTRLKATMKDQLILITGKSRNIKTDDSVKERQIKSATSG